MKNSMDR